MIHNYNQTPIEIYFFSKNQNFPGM